MGKGIFIDANIFLEVFLDDSKADQCEKFLKALYNSAEMVFTSDLLVYSCLLAIENKFRDCKKLENALIFFKSFSNLVILAPSLDELYDAVEIMKKEKFDFDDSLVLACMRGYEIKEIASLDRHFDKVKDIKRIKFD